MRILIFNVMVVFLCVQNITAMNYEGMERPKGYYLVERDWRTVTFLPAKDLRTRVEITQNADGFYAMCTYCNNQPVEFNVDQSLCAWYVRRAREALGYTKQQSSYK